MDFERAAAKKTMTRFTLPGDSKKLAFLDINGTVL